jgi:hypothetical protein
MTVPRAALLLASTLALALAACSGSRQADGLSRRAVAEARRGPPLRPMAQPTSIIAAEIALARAAREQGQWPGLSARATDDAQIAWNGAAAPAATWLTGRASPATPDRWQAREAWASCDGSAVVVTGIGHDAAGNWSRFTRVWERQGRDFRWSVTVWQPDAELTRTRREEAAQASADAAEDAIVVEAMNMIRARVAPCPQQNGRPRSHYGRDAAADRQPGLSRDGTLRWSVAPDAVTAWWQVADGWEQLHTQPLTAAGGA